MDFSSYEEKKSKPSFWGKLFKTSKKSSRKNDESFRRQSFHHSSFHCTKAAQKELEEEDGNFTTIESTELMDMHKDAGIIFVNKNHVHSLLAKEEERRVQFVPTPLNKYYKVNTKSAPLQKTKKGENKENLVGPKISKPTRPILRLGRSRENLTEKHSEVSGSKTLAEQGNSRLVNVSYLDGPELKKTPLMPRTSTRTALFDQNNKSLSHINLSGIARYGSLPRNARVSRELYFSQNANQTDKENSLYQSQETFSQFPAHRRTSEGFSNKYRRYSSQHFPRPGEVNPNVHQIKDLSTQIARLNTGESIIIQGKQLKDQHEALKSNKERNFDNNILSEKINRKIDLFPNKAINEVGLPLNIKKERRFLLPKQRSRSESPHYIPLAETYSSNIPFGNNIYKNGKNTQQVSKYKMPKVFDQKSNSEYPYQVILRQNVNKEKASDVTKKCPVNLLNQKYNENDIVHNTEHIRYISQTKKQAIVTRMYSQKRMLANKLCKYKSKECDEGFSSMADDECSFNCSCSSCASRFSKPNGKYNHVSNPIKEDKYFFIVTDTIESNEQRKLETVIESPIANSKLKCTEDEVEKEIDCGLKNTWYDCNDSLCKTPKNDTIQQNKTNLKNDSSDNKAIENIYENITQIINSATKQNYNSEQVQRVFSTPLSKAERTKINVNNTNLSRSLFPPEQKVNIKSETPSFDRKKITPPLNSPLFFSDSIILLQEIFQKLSLECQELLQPKISSNSTADSGINNALDSASPGDKYVNDLVKSLQAKEISEGDFANIIGNIAQNIFLEAKSKRTTTPLTKSSSLPTIAKKDSTTSNSIEPSSSLTNIFNQSGKQKTINVAEKHSIEKSEALQNSENETASLSRRDLPEGWSRSPTTASGATSTVTSLSKDDSTTSETDLQLLENAIRVGMGLSPISKLQKTPLYSLSPAKAIKYKSKDVLSCKGKLKLKIYHNSGLVTVHVIRAAKLTHTKNRDLNPYVKISMVTDETKRVNWRTSVQRAQKNPVFNQIFSFEVLVDDLSKRLVFSVWHRDFEKKRSELIGCMSFSVRHVLDNSHKINGWYRLLREGFGTEKHFAAHNHNSCPLKNKENRNKKPRLDLL